jgi:hypothetical protein
LEAPVALQQAVPGKATPLLCQQRGRCALDQKLCKSTSTAGCTGLFDKLAQPTVGWWRCYWRIAVVDHNPAEHKVGRAALVSKHVLRHELEVVDNTKDNMLLQKTCAKCHQRPQKLMLGKPEGLRWLILM